MKAPDISQSLIIKRYGGCGAKLFARIWFAVLYLMLIAVAAGSWTIGPEFAAGWRRIFVGCFVGTFLVFATSLLTRMHLKFLAEIEQLEARNRRLLYL
jgi:hypothetical protein